MKSIILKNTMVSIGIASVIFCVVGVVFDMISGGVLRMEGYSFTKMALGTLVIGIGFGVPSIVYENDSIPAGLQTLIHMGTGCVVMTITAFAVGWIPVDRGAGIAIGTVAGEIVVAFIIWFFFYKRQKKLAEEMNRRIAEMNRNGA